MNDVQAFIDRQLGIYSRTNYDNILKRLTVNSLDSFHGVQSSISTAGDFNPEPPIFACRFAEAPGYEHILALANEDGRVAIQDTRLVPAAASDMPLEGFQCHNNAVFDLAWMPGQTKFVTVSGDHLASLWDIEEGNFKRLFVYASHTRSVKTAVFRPSDPSVFATGARDGHILVWDIRSNANPQNVVPKPDNSLLNCHSTFTPKTPVSSSKRHRISDSVRATSITGLVFQNDMTLISSGECDGNIKVWDLRKNYNIYKKDPLPKHSIPYCGSSTKNGYTNLIIDSARVRLYASCMDNVIYCFNISTYNTLPEQRYVGHENGTFYIKTSLSPDCKYLVSGSSDKNAFIWNVKYSNPIVKLVGHSAEVTCAAWCQKGDTKIVTCSDDARHKMWKIGYEYLNQEDIISLTGRAEVMPRIERPPRLDWGALDKTPNSLKRKVHTTPSTNAKRAKSSPERSVSKKSKRCLTDMMNGVKMEAECSKRLKFDLSTIHENENRDPKSLKRRQSITTDGPSTSKKCFFDSTFSPPAQNWVYQSPKKVGSGDSFITPTKYYQAISPKCLTPKKSPKETAVTFSSPTVNLPNFVLDGEAPHLRLMSPVKQKEEKTNWLTLMVREKKSKTEIIPIDKSTQSPLSPKAENLLNRRNSANSEKTPKRNLQKKTLLKYFNVIGSKEK